MPTSRVTTVGSEARDSIAHPLSPKHEGVAAVYVFGGFLLWALGLGLAASFSWWYLLLSVLGTTLIVVGMSGGPWRQPCRR
jgi:hypothetical protein